MKFLLVGLFLFCGSLVLAAESTDANWKHESELAVALASGNSSATTVSAKQSTSYLWTQNLLRLNAGFLYTTSKAAGSTVSIKSAESWDAELRYERVLSKKFSIFAANGWQGNTFAGFDYRAIADLGAKYWFMGDAKAKNFFFNETGYRFQYEKRIPGTSPIDQRSHFVRVYFEYNRAINANLTFNLWIELLPDLADTDNFMFNFQPSINMVLNTNFSFRLAYLGKFDNQPAAAKKYDSLLTAALVAKF